MKVYNSFTKLKSFDKPVIAMGVFDGMHRAHVYLLKDAVRIARRLKRLSLLITFWPHPREKQSILSLEHRLRLAALQGIDAAIVVPFSRSFKRVAAESFVAKFIAGKINPSLVCVGENFRFGYKASGDTRLLKELAKKYAFEVKVYRKIKHRGKVISSTSVRAFIKQGDLDAASRLLGRRVSVLGTVIKGEGLAGSWGIPTANIDPHHEVLPPPGIYSCRVALGKKIHQGICYIGTKPTLFKQHKCVIEVHIFKLRKNLYGKDLEIYFLKKIREDRKFLTPSALIKQIKKDIISAKKHFFLPS